jgi:hypothetical protein
MLFLDEEDEGAPSETTTVTSTTTTVVSEGWLRAAWPAILTLLTRDQYGRLVYVPNLKVGCADFYSESVV